MNPVSQSNWVFLFIYLVKSSNGRIPDFESGRYRFESYLHNKMNKEEIKYLKLGIIWSNKGEKGFYLLPEDAAEIVNLVADGKVNNNGKKVLMDEMIRRNKDIAKYAYEIMLEKKII